jgi:hypothetical protein
MELQPEWLCWKKLSGNKFGLDASYLKNVKPMFPIEYKLAQ